MGAIGTAIDRLRIPRDGVLLVHSAFKGFRREGFEPVPVLEELCEAMERGTLLMPTMSWRFVNPSKPEFSELDTPSNTGVLTEIFRQRFALARSLHPTHSVAGRGKRTAEMLSEHHLDDTPCSARSPFGRLVAAEGWVAMLGIGFDCCTQLHHAEELVAPHLYLRDPAQAETYTCRDRLGGVHTVRVRRHYFLPRDYWQFQDALAAQGLLRIARIGNVVLRAFAAPELHRIALAALRERADAILARAGQRYRRM